MYSTARLTGFKERRAVTLREAWAARPAFRNLLPVTGWGVTLYYINLAFYPDCYSRFCRCCVVFAIALHLSGWTMSASEWKQKCAIALKLSENDVSMPDSVDWKSVYEKKPLGRNLLKNPSPFGLDHNTPPPEKELKEMPDEGPLPSIPEGDYSDWTTSLEVLPYDTSSIPAGAIICHLPQFSWFTLEQKVDLKAEGLWDELLDDFQPNIAIQDWYEESQLHDFIYELKVRLLGADAQTVIKEYTFTPKEDLSNYSHTWKRVSYVFTNYGPGVRHIHFLHKLKNMSMIEFTATRVTGSSVNVSATKGTSQ